MATAKPVVAFLSLYNKDFITVESDHQTSKGKFTDLLVIGKDLTGIIVQLKNKESSLLKALGQLLTKTIDIMMCLNCIK